MYDFILRILSLFEAASQTPVCAHILSTIDWEKKKHSFALMAKGFFFPFFFFLTYVTSQIHFYPIVLSLKIYPKVEL